MLDEHNALTKRHKASLQNFIDKNDWIQSKIRHLEGHPLPPIDAESSVLDDDTLSKLLHEHDQTETEVQELDNGELRALRSLAKAASSQKNLSSEDTDLIEITLKVLSSVDKLLHLLHIRGKELHLLQLKLKWKLSLQKVQADCSAILHEALPSFVKKARWKEPEESLSHIGQPNTVSPSETSTNFSPSSRRTTLTNSTMARQMRAEILSLDLASLTSRIHTLTHTTLAASGKLLDAMVDTSPVPLPESFLDMQDEIEVSVKKNVSGLVDFCHVLAKQWRQADEAYWACRDLQNCADTLRRDTQEATLKVPSEMLADAFQARMDDVQTRYDALASIAVSALPMPSLVSQLPEQDSCNVQVSEALKQTIQRTLAPLKACREAVGAYRKAAQALTAAQTYHKQIKETLTTIRQQMESLSIIPVDVARISDEDVNLEAAATQVRQLRQIADHAQNDLCTTVHGIIVDLINSGIDPNVRRSLQDSIATLERQSKQALILTDLEDRKLNALGELRRIHAAFVKDLEAITGLEDTISSSIRGVLSGALELPNVDQLASEAAASRKLEDTISFSIRGVLSGALELPNVDQLASEAAASRKLEDTISFSIRGVLSGALELPNVDQLASEAAASRKRQNKNSTTCDTVLDALSNGTSGGLVYLRAYMQKRISDLKDGDKKIQDLLDLLVRVLKHREEVVSASEQADQLEMALKDFCIDLSSVRFDTVDSEGLQARYDELVEQTTAFKHSLTARISFLSGIGASEEFGLVQHDQSVRLRFNEKCAGMESQLHNTASSLEVLRSALEAYQRLQRDQERTQAMKDQIAAVKADKQLTSLEQLMRLQCLRANHEEFLTSSCKEDDGRSDHTTGPYVYQGVRALQLSLRSQREDALVELARLIQKLEADAELRRERSLQIEGLETRENNNEEQRVASEALPEDTPHFLTQEEVHSTGTEADQVAEESMHDITLSSSSPSDKPSVGNQAAAMTALSDQHGTDIEDSVKCTVLADDLPKEQLARAQAECVEGPINVVAQEAETFNSAVRAADEAISVVMDILDKNDDDGGNSIISLRAGLDQAKQALHRAQRTAVPLSQDVRVQQRLNHIQTVWEEVNGHVISLGISSDTPSISRSASRASSKAHSLDDILPSSLPSAVSAPSGEHQAGGSRLAGTSVPSRLPVINDRLRRKSSASVPSGITSPLSRRPDSVIGTSKLPRPSSASSSGFRTPTLASNARKVSSTRHYSTLTPLGAPRLPLSASSRVATTHDNRETPSVHSSSHSHSSIHRRSSGDHTSLEHAKPNRYRAKSDHKLDTAVGRIVNAMTVPVSISPAEADSDEVGKYWIGDPPKLYYARILRSRTVMLRVGAGWQELGSFLATHLTQMFSTGESINTATDTIGSGESLSTDDLSERMARPRDAHWITAASLKTSQESSSSRRSSFKSPRSVSLHHMSPLRQSYNEDMAFDLTALLVKSTSRSPPTTSREGSRHKDPPAPIPWKI